jgi:hypothetical protein
MKLPRLGRPSPAIVIALLALLVATTGVSWAASPGPSAKTASSAGPAKAANSLRGPRGKRGKRGLQGPVGPAGKNGKNGKDGKDGTNGINGTNGVNGTALGYATVSGGLTLIPGGSSNVTQANIIPVAAGYVCFGNLPFTPKVATVSLTHPVTSTITSNVNTLLASVRVGPDPLCPGAQASVVTNSPTGTLANGEFQVVFN